jgi:hypothetical protein
MRWPIVLLAAAATAVTAAWPPVLVASFPAPPGTLEVGYSGWRVYALVDNPPRVYEIAPYTGSVYGSFTLAIPSGVRGITAAETLPTDLFVSNNANNYLYCVSTSGSVLSSFVCPGSRVPYGLGGSSYPIPPDFNYLAVACQLDNAVLYVNRTTGSLVSSFVGPAAAVACYDGYMAVDNNVNNLYWNYSGAWQIIATLPAQPRGVDATVMWPTRVTIDAVVVCADGMIYQYGGWTSVTPASFGRVKTTFR